MADLATNYYLKALDNYPYDLPESMEALEYALSYDEEHAGAHCLMGLYYFEQLKDFKRAFYHFEQALVYDIEHIDTYLNYSTALIQYGAYDQAKKVIKHAETIPGICKACLLTRKALIHELKEHYFKAEKALEKAKRLSVDDREINYIKEIMERVKEKQAK